MSADEFRKFLKRVILGIIFGGVGLFVLYLVLAVVSQMARI